MRNICVTLALAGAICGCFQSNPSEAAGGGGMETTEGNIASLGAGTAGTRVTLIPAGFDPLRDSLPDSLTTTADSAGHYAFRGLQAGRYNLEAFRPQDGWRCFRAGIEVKRGKVSTIARDTLRAPGRARLHWDGARKGILLEVGRRFRRDLKGAGSDSGGVLLDSLPAGLLPPFVFAAGPSDTSRQRWTDSVRVGADSQASVLGYGEWAHRGTLDWSSAARIPDTLDDFPLLVRLRSPGFDFSEAAAGGKDLRFTSASGDPLPFEVERWDAASAHAEIWVLWKKSGSVAHQTLCVFWGNPAATALSAPHAVFDSALGYAGVWHLSDSATGGNGALYDASGLDLKTLPQELTADPNSAIGTGQRFNGIGGYAFAVDKDGLHGAGPWLASAWIAPDLPGAVSGPRTVLAKWEPNDSAGFILALNPDGKSVRFTLGFGNHVDRLDAAPPQFANGEWHLLEAGYDGAQATITWDGAPIAQAPAGPGTLPATTRDIVIGARGDADASMAEIDFFQGGIDEARVERIIPTPERLRLDYETQSPGSATLIFTRLK